NASYGATDPGTVTSVEVSTNYLGPDIVPSAGASSVIWRQNLVSGNYAVATFVPYNNSGVRGTPITIKVLGSGVTGPLAPTVAVATFPGAGGGNWAFPAWTVIKVTFNTTPSVGDWIALFQGTPLVTIHTVTSADITAGFCLVTDPTAVFPNTYVYTATQLQASTGIGAAAQTTVTMRAGFTLTAPSLTWSNYVGTSGAGKLVAITVPANTYPPTAQADMQYRVGVVGPPWTDLGSLPAGDNYLAAVPGGFIGTIYAQATVSCPGYTTSSAGSGNVSYP